MHPELKKGNIDLKLHALRYEEIIRKNKEDIKRKQGQLAHRAVAVTEVSDVLYHKPRM